jgi:signal transduction histidine kinase/CheY-like chemotaxis protein
LGTLKETLKKLRREIDLAIESERGEDYVHLRKGLEAALDRLKAEDSASQALNREIDAVASVWFKGAAPSTSTVDPQGCEEAASGLIKDILSVQEFVLVLSEGDLSGSLQAKGIMAGRLKALQANLRHLTWQTQAIAKGDFSQRVDFMGDFSDSFNAMVGSLVEMREALEAGKREVELRVKERTSELSKAYKKLRAETEERERVEDELRQAQKMEALGTLSGGIAHDFNNILAGVIGFTEMVLEQTPEDAPMRRKLELILKSALRGRELVKQILTFSRRAKPEKREVAMSAVIEESLNLLKPILPPSVEIKKSFKNVRDTLLADQVQLHQIIMNLATNAAYFMQEKGGVIEIGLADREFDEAAAAGLGMRPGPYIELSVKDTGCGIPKNHLGKVFDPFFTTKKPGQGTGMGLSVVHGIVKGHGGSIVVESEPGKGATFRVFLPGGGEAGLPKGIITSQEKGRGERILFVDDEETLVEMNLARLKGLGYQVVGHTDAGEALKAFRAEPYAFDLVITDYAMPSMTGVDFARSLLKIRPDIPVALCSGFNDSLKPGILEGAGIRAFAGKTMSKRELAAFVRRALTP